MRRQRYIGWGILLSIGEHHWSSVCVLPICCFFFYLFHYYLNSLVALLIKTHIIVFKQHLTLSLSTHTCIIARFKYRSLMPAFPAHHSHRHFLQLFYLAPVVHQRHVVLLRWCQVEVARDVLGLRGLVAVYGMRSLITFIHASIHSNLVKNDKNETYPALLHFIHHWNGLKA